MNDMLANVLVIVNKYVHDKSYHQHLEFLSIQYMFVFVLVVVER